MRIVVALNGTCRRRALVNWSVHCCCGGSMYRRRPPSTVLVSAVKATLSHLCSPTDGIHSCCSMSALLSLMYCSTFMHTETTIAFPHTMRAEASDPNLRSITLHGPDQSGLPCPLWKTCVSLNGALSFFGNVLHVIIAMADRGACLFLSHREYACLEASSRGLRRSY